MLGTTISDPDQIEGSGTAAVGLGFLDVQTVMKPEKRVRLALAHDRLTGSSINGYEIHIGETTGSDCLRSWLQVGEAPHGASSANGRIRGCYLHGLFTSDAYRAAFLHSHNTNSTLSYDADVEATLDALAAHLELHLDIDQIIKIAR